MKLTEILDRPMSIKIIQQTPKSYRGIIEIGERQIEFRFSAWPEPGKWNFTFVELDDEFRDGETFGATGRGNELQIFASAKKFLEDAIKLYSPKAVYFEADKSGKDSRASLYDRFVKRWQPEGYRHRKVFADDTQDYHAFVEKSFYDETYADEKGK